MRRCDLFWPTSRDDRGVGTESTRLLVRAGVVTEFGSGLWGLTPVGRRIDRQIRRRLHEGMQGIGAQEVRLPGLQYRERWSQSGRWGQFEGEMFTLENREGAAMCLAPSHEEGMVHLLDGLVRSYHDLPLTLYQIDAKFRDDHPRGGLLRSKEFTMKDAYSFHADEASLAEMYREMRTAYDAIFTDLGLRFAICEAENSVMGGDRSEEFVAPVESDGSCRLVSCAAEDCRFGLTDEHVGYADLTTGDAVGGVCPDCGGELVESEGVEVGHIFELGTRYSAAMWLTVDAEDGSSVDVVMGSYGIGVDRLLQTLVMQHADEDGLRWPVTDWGTVAPYCASLVSIGDDEVVRGVTERLHAELGDDCLWFDDESQSVGERFAESDLLGVPTNVVVGNTYRETGEVELETRDGERRVVAPDAVGAELSTLFGDELTALFDDD
jgi:prolyl-tRNA synthetase